MADAGSRRSHPRGPDAAAGTQADTGSRRSQPRDPDAAEGTQADTGSRRSRVDPDEPRDPYAGEGRQAPPKTVAEALARARLHGRAAAAETLAAVRALIEAVSLAASGHPSEASRLLGPLAKLLEGLEGELGRGPGDGSSRVLDSVAAAIDDEISLWQERARNDTDARTILRAFLGLREILWELGVGRGSSSDDPAAEAAQQPRTRPRRQTGRPQGPRMERVPVQGGSLGPRGLA